MLRRKKPLQRKTSLRNKKPFWARTKHPHSANWDHQKAKGELARRKPMRKVSRARAKRIKTEYYPANNAYLSLPENQYCHLCISRTTGMTRDEMMRAFEKHQFSMEMLWTQFLLAGAQLSRSTEIHHCRGRAGKLLSDHRFFASSCRNCREWPHANPREARSLQFLASAAEWNTVPKNS